MRDTANEAIGFSDQSYRSMQTKQMKGQHKVQTSIIVQALR